MKLIVIYLLVLFPLACFCQSDNGRAIIDLNGEWQFDQTTNAFPPAKFTRTIPVPGLVHLAKPAIADYDKFFKRSIHPGTAGTKRKFPFLKTWKEGKPLLPSKKASM